MPPKLTIVYEDSDLLICDKPAGLLVHPAPGGSEPTLVDFARLHTQDTDPDRPGIVHRLDKNTSGLVIVAKTVAAKTYLQSAFKNHEIQKTYLALVSGHPSHSQAIIRLPIMRQSGHPARRKVAVGGRDSETHYLTVGNYGPYSLLELKPKSGRTHQLRVHLSHLGHPLVGDSLYGKVLPKTLNRQFLHASKLEFVGPSGQNISVSSPLPPDLQAFLDFQAV